MPHPSKPQILVVDDEASIRESFAMLLTSVGYDVTIAKDGFDALLQLKRSLPDLIGSDLNMPQMSGFEFLSVGLPPGSFAKFPPTIGRRTRAFCSHLILSCYCTNFR